MIVVMRKGATDEEVEAVVARARELGLRGDVSRGEERTVVGLVGSVRPAPDPGALESLPGVAEVVRLRKPWELASREAHPARTVVTVGRGPGAVRIGGDEIAVVAGPCAVESWDQILAAARAAKEGGARLLRGGAFKPRTSPYSFQGLGEEGLRLLARAAVFLLIGGMMLGIGIFFARARKARKEAAS